MGIVSSFLGYQNNSSDNQSLLKETQSITRPNDLTEELEQRIYLKLSQIIKPEPQNLSMNPTSKMKIGYLNLETLKMNQLDTIQRDPIKRQAYRSEQFRFFTRNLTWYNYLEERLRNSPDLLTPIELITSEIDLINQQFQLITLEQDGEKGLNHLKKNSRKPIPQIVRLQTWRQHTGGSMDGTCFSCLKPIKLDGSSGAEPIIPLYGQVIIKEEKLDNPYRWECGHILSSKDGGPDLPINLRPLCFDCNRTMGSKHLYLYMIEQSTEGVYFLEAQNLSLVLYLKSKLSRVLLWEKKIHLLIRKNQISRDESNKLHRKLYDEEASERDRDEILQKIERINYIG